MQQPSVSASIKQLERALGLQLFQRNHRKIELTPSGEKLFSGIERGFGDIERTIASVLLLARSEHVTLNSSSAFSYYWMIPRLSQLHRSFPGIDLRMQTSDREPDLDVENIDLAIRLGRGDWPGYHTAKIADEVIMPVGSPDAMAAVKLLQSVEQLVHQRLIHLEEPVRIRPTWQQWFEHHGVVQPSPSGGLRFNDYAMVLQAAASGEGIAFGWQHIVQNLVDHALLGCRSDWAWETGNGIYLVWSKSMQLSQKAVLVRDWIISVAEESLAIEETSM